MANPYAAEQQAAYEAIYDPASPSYHHYLSAAQVAQRFGVSDASSAAIRTWATRDGLNLVSTTGTHEYLLLEGTAAQVQKTFAVTLRQYTQAGHSFYANTAGPTVPAGLGIAGVLGLNSRNRAQTFHTKPPASAPHGPTPAQGMCTGSTCIGLTTPQDLWSIYDQPGDNFGEGQQMAVFGEGKVQPVLVRSTPGQGTSAPRSRRTHPSGSARKTRPASLRPMGRRRLSAVSPAPRARCSPTARTTL